MTIIGRLWGDRRGGIVCSQSQYAAPVLFSTQGTAGNPITVKAQNKWGAILDCQLPYGYSGDGTDGVQACDTYFDFGKNAAYIVIQGFDIQRSFWTGANVNGNNNHDIQFVGNHFHNIGNRHYTVDLDYGITGTYAGTGSSNITWDGNMFNNIGRLPTAGYNSTDYNHDHGLYIYNGPYTITNNIFYANTAGWGIQISPGTHDTNIINNTFRGPNPQRDGLIVLWADSSHPNTDITIRNNVFYNGRNYAIDSWQANEVTTLIDDNIVYGSPSGLINTSVITGSISVTNNRINTDPLFVNASANDYHLQPASPAIDTGASVLVMDDFDGNPRPQGAGFDVGAYEYAGAITSPVSTNSFDFSAATSTSSVALSKNHSASVSVNATLLSGSTQAAAFSISGLPPGVRAFWSTTTCALSCSSSLNLTVSSPHASTGTSVITVMVTAAGTTKTANVTLTMSR